MIGPGTDDMKHQRVLVAAMNAEMGGRGWTRKYLGERAGITPQQMERIFNLKRPMNVEQFGAIADALGVSMDYLAGESQRWAGISHAPASGPSPEQGMDPRTLIRALLDDPDSDAELNRRLSEARGLTGVSAARMKRLTDEIRSLRQGELERALDALPTTGEQRNAN
jgi:transcriptional regulator with XRE-family HTH domain